MQGTITERIQNSGRDNSGKARARLKVYDVSYRFTDPTTGQRKQAMKRGFRRKQDAEAFLLRINKQQSEGSFVAQTPVLMRDFLLDWLETCVKLNVRESSYHEYKRIILHHLIPQLGGIELQRLSPTQIDRMYALLLTHGRADGTGGLAPRSVLYTHRVLNAALNHALKQRLITYNPTIGVSNTPKPRKYQVDVYTPEELLKLLAAAKDTTFEVPIALAGVCGLRRGECLGMDIGCIDFENNVLRIERQLIDIEGKLVFSEPKSEESQRVIHGPDEVFAILQRRIAFIAHCKEVLRGCYADNNLLVCENDGRPIPPKSFTHRFKVFLKKNGFRPIRFHDLRHSCASLMLKSGVELKTASAILGHSSIGITADLYTHVLEDTKKAAAERIGQELFGNKDKSQ